MQVSPPWTCFRPNQKIKCCALIVHGLNLKPEKMDAISLLMSEAGVYVVRLALTGHRGIPGEMQVAHRQQWHKDILEAHEHAKKIADQEQVDVNYIGYSLGGLLGVDLQLCYPEIKWKRSILLAPALRVRPLFYLLKFLAFIPFIKNLPSFAYKDYRVHSYTSLQAYDAAMQVIQHFEQTNSVIPSDTLMLVDLKDEVVDGPGLIEANLAKRFLSYKIELVTKTPPANPLHHMIIDESCVGAACWEGLSKIMIDHFTKD